MTIVNLCWNFLYRTRSWSWITQMVENVKTTMGWRTDRKRDWFGLVGII